MTNPNWVEQMGEYFELEASDEQETCSPFGAHQWLSVPIDSTAEEADAIIAHSGKSSGLESLFR